MKSTNGYKKNSRTVKAETNCAVTTNENHGALEIRVLDCSTERISRAFRVEMTKNEALALANEIIEAARSIA